MSALFIVADATSHTDKAFPHDLQRWKVNLDDADALLSAVFENRLQLLDQDFTFLHDCLSALAEFIRMRIEAATDQPHQQLQPIHYLAQPIYTGQRGRPRIEFNRDFLRTAYEFGTTARLSRSNIPASERTIRRRLVEYGIRQPGLPIAQPIVNELGEQTLVYRGRQPRPRELTEEELDRYTDEALTIFPNLGLSMLWAYIKAQGFSPPRDDVAASFRRVNGPPARFGRPAIQRRTYKVPGPNSLWHHDGHHKLIRWKIVTHAFIDGYSRLVVGIHAVNNNRSETVLRLFLAAVEQWGRPSRVRGDYGVENKGVAENQERERGLGRGSYIFGRSVHNIRIERLWVDIMKGYIGKWSDFFRDLEQHHGLDIDNDHHIWLLHYLYLEAINNDAKLWAITWNFHHMRLPEGQEGGQKPIEQYLMGMAEKGIRGLEELEDQIYGEEEGEYGVDWTELDDSSLVTHLLERRGTNNEQPSPTAPPHWSHVIVTPPESIPITPDQIKELDDHLCGRLDITSNRMDDRRLLWVHASRYFNQLVLV
ncbi:hypothetical protein FS842_010572 [Serendipita sp. 407]|nr:hypothetical protein FS842_010572 [Serendipita sp. 407]